MAQLECPEERGPAQRTVALCHALVRADGTVAQQIGKKATYCIGGKVSSGAGGPSRVFSTGQYTLAVEKALNKARFLPAEVDGVPVPVDFTFQVNFDDKGQCVATAYPNWGDQAAELGVGYVAPQEIMTEGGWTRRFNVVPIPGLFTAISVRVDETGAATDARVEFIARGVTANVARTQKYVLKAFQKASFIPGFHRGAPHAMRYAEVIEIVR